MESEIRYQRLEKEHEAAALQNVVDNFYEDEILIRGIDCCRGGDKHLEIEEFMNDLMKQGMSIIALAPNGDVAGVALNAWLHKDEITDVEADLQKIQDPKFRSILRFMEEANAKVDFFKKFPNIDRIFDFRVLSVDSKYRGQGIGKRLLERTEHLARELGAEMMVSDYTGHFSQRISEKCDWQLAHEIYYDDYLDENGEIVFKLDPPHVKMQIKYKILD